MRKIALNGWQRLWIVISTMYLVVVVYFLAAFLRDIIGSEPYTPARILGLIGIAAAIWVLPLIAIYVVGMLAGWIARGFRTNAP